MVLLLFGIGLGRVGAPGWGRRWLARIIQATTFNAERKVGRSPAKEVLFLAGIQIAESV